MAYTPYGYQPQGYGGYYGAATQPMPDQLAQLRGAGYQPPQTAQMQPQAPQQANGGLLWVQGEAGAKSYLVAPGNSVLLMDSETCTFYIKSADSSGMPSMRTFDYSERVAAQPAQGQPAAQPDPARYVTREEFDALAAKLEALAAKETPKRKTGKEAAENGQSAV